MGFNVGLRPSEELVQSNPVIFNCPLRLIMDGVSGREPPWGCKGEDDLLGRGIVDPAVLLHLLPAVQATGAESHARKQRQRQQSECCSFHLICILMVEIFDMSLTELIPPPDAQRPRRINQEGSKRKDAQRRRSESSRCGPR